MSPFGAKLFKEISEITREQAKRFRSEGKKAAEGVIVIDKRAEPSPNQGNSNQGEERFAKAQNAGLK